MPSPKGESEGRPVTRSGRLLGLVAAVGFSIAMWVFIAVAVLGLVLKVIGPRQDLDSKGIAAALTRAYDDVTEGANHPDSLSDRSAADAGGLDLGAADGKIIVLGEPAPSTATPPAGRK
jgi:cobalamin synthase